MTDQKKFTCFEDTNYGYFCYKFDGLVSDDETECEYNHCERCGCYMQSYFYKCIICDKSVCDDCLYPARKFLYYKPICAVHMEQVCNNYTQLCDLIAEFVFADSKNVEIGIVKLIVSYAKEYRFDFETNYIK